MPNIQDIFGKVDPSKDPAARGLGFLEFGSGAAGIGNFLSALIQLIYIIAALFLVFMIFWGALDWILSGGDKEKVTNARNKIIHAIIGILIFAVALAIINLLEDFLGFEFFG